MIAGPYLAACLLLAVAGSLKVRAPANTATAARALGLPLTSAAVRAVGGGEVALGAVAVVSGSPPAAAAVAASYVAFAAFVTVALARRLPLSTCGCFGGIDTPPTALHVVVNLAAAGVAVVAALRPPGPLVDVVAAEGWGQGSLLLVLAAVTAALAGLALSELPRARALRVRRAS